MVADHEPDTLALDSTDQRIRDAILAEMLRQPWSDVENTTVMVTSGAVTLGGHCRSEKARYALRVMAERVESVRRVVDQLRIGAQPAAAHGPLFPGI